MAADVTPAAGGPGPVTVTLPNVQAFVGLARPAMETQPTMDDLFLEARGLAGAQRDDYQASTVSDTKTQE